MWSKALAWQNEQETKIMDSNPHSPDPQRYMRDTVRVLQAASDLRGNFEEALFWHFNHPIRDFEGKTEVHIATKLTTSSQSD